MLKGVIGLGSLLLDVAAKIYPDSKDISTAADAAGKARHAYNVVSTTSVHQSANRAIIAPMVCVEEGLAQAEFTNDLMQIVMLRDIVATLTHLSLQNTVEMGVKVADVIGTISPNRAGMLAFSGLEAIDSNLKKKGGDQKEDTSLVNYVEIGNKVVADLMEYTPLAVGKVVTATLYGEGGKRIDFPLTFRQLPILINPKDLKTIFNAAKAEDGFFARLMMMKTKEITGPELLTGRDLVKERFKIQNKDMSGYYKEAVKRDTGNKSMAIRTGLVSLNTLANSFIISSDSAIQLELEIGKRLSDNRSRVEIFKAVKANTIVVCNQDRGIFTFYTHGSDMPEEYTRKQIAIKSKQDNGSNNLADLVKILNGGM